MSLLMVCFLLSGDWTTKFSLLNDSIIKASLVLLLWLVIGVLYSHSYPEALKSLIKYSRLLLIWCLLYFYSCTAKENNWHFVIYALCLGALINLILIFINYYLLPVDSAIRFSKDVWPSPKGHFEFGFFMTLTSLAMMLLSFYSQASLKAKGLLFILASLGFYSVLFLNTSKTGYIMSFSVMMLVLFLSCRAKGVLFGVMLLVLLLISCFKYATHFREAANQTINEVQSFSVEKKHELSAELRLYWYKTLIDLVRETPLKSIAGYGTGSLISVSDEYQEKRGDTIHQAIENPHNQILLLLVENGVIGVGLFFYLLLNLLARARQQKAPFSILGIAMVLCMLEGCLLNSWLKDLAPACLFYVYSALICCTSKSQP